MRKADLIASLRQRDYCLPPSPEDVKGSSQDPDLRGKERAGRESG